MIDQASLEVERGAIFDERALTRAQTRVFNLGVFAGTRLTTGHPDLERGEVPVVVNVQEAPFQTLRLGPGIAFQTSRWEVQGLASWTNRNFLGDLRKLQLEAQVGYAWLPTPIRASQQGMVGQVTASFEQPGDLRPAGGPRRPSWAGSGPSSRATPTGRRAGGWGRRCGWPRAGR